MAQVTRSPRRRVGYAAPIRSADGLNTLARVVNVVLGCWLFASAFLWEHTPVHFHNAWIVGLLLVAFAVWAFWWPPARYFDTTLALWLVLASVFMAQGARATLINNMIVGLAVFVVSLVPSRFEGPPLTLRRRAEVR